MFQNDEEKKIFEQLNNKLKVTYEEKINSVKYN